MNAIRRAGPNPIGSDIELIVAKAKARLTGQPVSDRREWLVGNVLNDLRDSNDYDDIERETQFLIDDLDACRIVLQGVLNETIDAENVYVSRERFGETWRKRRQREIKEAFRKDPEEGRGRWLATYMEALAASRFDVCHQMTFEDWLRPGSAGALQDWPVPGGLTTLRTGAAALDEGRYRDAVENLEMLASTEEDLLDRMTRAAVLVLLALTFHRG